VVVYVPSAYTAFESLSRFEDPEIEAPLRAYSRLLRAYFSRKATLLGYRYIDTTPAMQQASRELPSQHRLYFRSNVHLTQQGHELVARLVAQELTGIAAPVHANPIP
jgi:lysophospholipase L1-like esterase